jgi:hypothetical protein
MNRRNFVKLLGILPVTSSAAGLNFPKEPKPVPKPPVPQSPPKITEGAPSDTVGSIRYHIQGEYQMMEMYNGTEWMLMGVYRNGIIQ